MKELPDELKSIPPDVLALVTAQTARQYHALPVRFHGKKLVIAVVSAAETRTLKAIQFATDKDVEPLVVAADLLAAAIEYHYAERRPAAPARPATPTAAPAQAPPARVSPPPAPAAPPPPAARAQVLRAQAPAAGDLDVPLIDDIGFDDFTMPTEKIAPSDFARTDFGPDIDAEDPFTVPMSPSAFRSGGTGVPGVPGQAPPQAPPAAPAAGPRASAPPPPMPPPIQKPVAIEQVATVDVGRLEKPQPAALLLVSADTARNFKALPLEIDDKTVTVAFAESPDAKAVRAIQYATGKIVRPVLAPKEALEAAILRCYPARAPKAPQRFAQIPAVDPRLLAEIEPDVIALLKPEAARKYRAVAVEKMGRRLTVAMEDPTDLQAIQDLEFVAGHTIKALRCDTPTLDAAIEKFYPPPPEVQADQILEGADLEELAAVEVIDEDKRTKETPVHDLEAMAEDAPAVKLSNMLIKEAVVRGASDIHIETYENDFRVRYRVDGILYEVSRPARAMRDSLISRIKVLAGMNIAETRTPQDGRIKLKMKAGDRQKSIDLRVSDLPTIWGEKIVMRVLDSDRLMLDLTKLGFEESSLASFQRAIVKPYGMILVVGPSGCGKTNTLYSAMTAINNPEVNIMTAEDPVEFNIKGINQVQADEGVGRTFAVALRSFLRQDPNIILVGEIRDFETAEISVKASLTGHLVLSTLHTTDAPTTISRMVNMGIEPYLVATSVLLISAQRLVRKICPDCAEPDPRPDSELLGLGYRPEDLPVVPMKGRGCMKCHQMGTKGRTAVIEVLEFSDGIRDLIFHGATPVELKLKAQEEGMISLRRSGLLKIKQGMTTVEEVTRETIK